MTDETANPPPSDNELDEHMNKPAPAPVAKPANTPTWLLASLVVGTLLTSVAASTVVQRLTNPPMRIATVDIGSVVEMQQLVMMDKYAANKGKPLEQNAGEAYDNVEKFGKQLEETLAAMRIECKCLVLTKGAVVGEASMNLTGELRARLGLNNVDVAALRTRVSERLFSDDPRQALAAAAKR